MKIILSLVFLTCCLLAAATGCAATVTANKLTAEDITAVWIETLPAKSDSPKYTSDPETIQTIADYINGLKLRPRTEQDEDVAGMSMRIEIFFSDGVTREYWHNGNLYFYDSENGEQYVMEYEQANDLESVIYAQMQTAPLVRGTVEQISDGENNRKSLLVNVDPATQELVGDKTTVSVALDRVFDGYQSYSEINAGDIVEFYVDGGVNESYPTQCGAWRLMILPKPEVVGGVSEAPEEGAISETSDPHYVVFSKLFSDDPGLNGGIKNIAVDLSKVKTEDNSAFIALMSAFCEKEGYTLLEDSIDGLIEKGVIQDLYYEDGIVVSFEDTELTETTLATKATKWRSGLGAIGGEYWLEKKDGEWSITEIGAQWIS